MGQISALAAEGYLYVQQYSKVCALKCKDRRAEARIFLEISFRASESKIEPLKHLEKTADHKLLVREYKS